MSHIVIHDDSSNVTHYAQFDDLRAAAAHLEELVNENSGSNARLYALEPVEFAVKSYVRVEIGGQATEPAAPTPMPAAETAVAELPPDDAPMLATEVFTDAPADDTVEYVEAAMGSADHSSPGTPLPERNDDPTAGETRRGLFGR